MPSLMRLFQWSFTEFKRLSEFSKEHKGSTTYLLTVMLDAFLVHFLTRTFIEFLIESIPVLPGRFIVSQTEFLYGIGLDVFCWMLIAQWVFVGARLILFALDLGVRAISRFGGRREEFRHFRTYKEIEELAQQECMRRMRMAMHKRLGVIHVMIALLFVAGRPTSLTEALYTRLLYTCNFTAIVDNAVRYYSYHVDGLIEKKIGDTRCETVIKIIQLE